MKRIIVISLFLVISALIVILPYEESTSIIGTSKVSIYKDIASIFTEGCSACIVVLFVLLPLALLLQIRQSPLRWYQRVFFLLEGIIALFAALVIYMSSAIPMPLVFSVNTPIFYVALYWVLLGAIASILLAIKRLYVKAAKFLYS